ncbi:MAG: TIGR03619 family F420-dependent LLM class oxidoreductase [Pseudomonadota bacterium]
MRIGVSLPTRELKDDLGALRAFAQLAEELGLTHLRIPDQVMRPGSGYLHEPMTLLAYIAAVTEKIELVPSVIVLPSRQTVLFAKQAATLDKLSNGRLRLGIGVGGSEPEYGYLNEDFHTRGRRCDAQMELLHKLWSEREVEHKDDWHTISGAGLNPLPTRSIPMWIGARGMPAKSVVRRMGRLADGWFVLCDPDQFAGLQADIATEARAAGRDPESIGTEAGVAVVGPREAEWRSRVADWRQRGLTHLCLRTLGGDLDAQGHLDKLAEVVPEIPG